LRAVILAEYVPPVAAGEALGSALEVV
jgi:hypothetical protein